MLIMSEDISILTQKAKNAATLRIFLDYDGTLADFAPSPDMILPDPQIIFLIEDLVSSPGVYPAIISGRRLAHMQKLLPLKGLLLGGTYGIEMQLPNGDLYTRIPFEQVRPTIEKLLPLWRELIVKTTGFYLEDKGWSLALHARFADPSESIMVMTSARHIAQAQKPGSNFLLSGNSQFLELAPIEANKAMAVQLVLNEMTPKDSLIIYLGDDEKDEEAFVKILAAEGYAVRVSAKPVETRAQYQIEGPKQVRAWLGNLLAARETKIG